MTKFIAIVSGKGGVGKTTSTLNVGKALVDLGHKVLLLDANLVTPNIAIQLGFMNPEGTVNKFLRKEKSLKDITYLHESGVSVIPASPSYTEFQKTNPQALPEIFEHLDDTTDFVLVDAPSGLGFDVTQVIKNCDEALIVVNPNLSSVMDGLKTIQLVNSHEKMVTGILLNMSNSGRNELSTEEVQNILGYQIIANVKYDRKMRKAVHKQMPLNYLYPHSRSAKQFSQIAKHVAHET